MEMTKKEFKKQQKARMKEIKKFNSKMYKKYNKEKSLWDNVYFLRNIFL